MKDLSKQHYLPATYIGNFSNDKNKSRRKRVIWVYRKKDSKIFNQTAENVAAKKGIYIKMVDDLWSNVEIKLQQSIDQLINSESMDAVNWINMVQFISQLFVRPPEFSIRFKKRFSDLGEEIQQIVEEEGCQFPRLFELQRLRAPIMYSDWKVIHNKTLIPIITNDLGYTLTQDINGKPGYTIPLDKNSALMITENILKRNNYAPIYYDDIKSKWLTTGIKHVYIYDNEDILSLNESLCGNAIEEIYGNTEYIIKTIGKSCSCLKNRESGYDTFLLSQNSNYLRKHEMDFLKVLSIISQPPDDSIKKLIKEIDDL